VPSAYEKLTLKGVDSMEVLVGLIVGAALASFAFAYLYDYKKTQNEEFVSIIFRVEDAKLCGNCSAVYDALEHRCCPKCTSTNGMFIIHYIESEDPKIEMIRKHIKDMRAGKFRKVAKPAKVVSLESARKVSASDHG
jgi:Zn finger protein HypA/HybF involved in hydrogenase expression